MTILSAGLAATAIGLRSHEGDLRDRAAHGIGEELGARPCGACTSVGARIGKIVSYD